MPFSVLTYYAANAVQNKNLIDRMKFTKYFFVGRLTAFAVLSFIDTLNNKTIKKFDTLNLHLLL